MVSHSSFGRLVLVTGPESLRAERAVVAAKRAALQEDPDAQVTDVEAGTLSGAQLAEMTNASLFAAASIAVIRDLAALPADLAEPVAALAADVPDNVALIVQHSGGNKGKGLLDKLKKTRPETVDCPAFKPYELPDFVVQEARGRGARIDTDTARALVAAVGNDARALAAAVDQLLSDADGAALDIDLVTRYFAGRAEVTAYAVADDVLAGRISPALEKLRWALETGVTPPAITGSLATSLRMLGRYVAARDARMSQGELCAAVGCSPWKLKDLAQQSKTWSEERIAHGLTAVARTDGQVKGGSATSDFALEDLVIKLARRPERPPRSGR